MLSRSNGVVYFFYYSGKFADGEIVEIIEEYYRRIKEGINKTV
jgi:hypothetical protein